VKLTVGRIAAAAFALAAAFGCAALLVPQIEATGAREPLRLALERTLQRKVEFRDVRYQLLPSPGLSASDLVISEDEAYGIEPFAYVTELHVGLRWSSLLGREYDFSSVRLSDASINLSRDPKLGWNMGFLLERLAQGSRGATPPPRLLVRAGRINFRSGTLKSPFFLNNVELELDAPARPGGPIRWAYEASPARTDRAEQGFGRFSGSGTWDPAAGGDGLADIEVELERSVIGEVLTLFTGRDPGVQGRIASRARLRGPLNRIAVTGQLQVAELERPGIFGLRSRDLSLPYEGMLDLSVQDFELHSTQTRETSKLPVNLRFSASSVLVNPRWKAELNIENLPAPATIDIARRFGADLPEGLLTEGRVDGVIRAGSETAVDGQLTLRDAAFPLGEAGAARVAEAQILFGPDGMKLRPATAISPSATAVLIEGAWNPALDSVDFSLDAARLPLTELALALSIARVNAPLPALSSCADGYVAGPLRIERIGENPVRWSGSLQVSGLACAVEGLPPNLRIEKGAFTLDGPRWGLRRAAGVAGGLAWEGDLSIAPGTPRPVRVQLTLPETSLAMLERIIAPALEGPRGLLDRTLPFRRRQQPAWLRNGGVEGGVRIRAFDAGGLNLEELRAKLFWMRSGLELAGLEAKWQDAEVLGRATMRGGAAGPVYEFRGRVEGLAWQGGSVDGEVDLVAQGPAAAAGARMQMSGLFTAVGLNLGEEQAAYASGSFDYDAQRSAGRLRLRSLEIHSGGEILVGGGASGSDGRMVVEAASPRRAARLEGTLDPFVLTIAAGEASRTR
jgi:hypothetical protein